MGVYEMSVYYFYAPAYVGRGHVVLPLSVRPSVHHTQQGFHYDFKQPMEIDMLPIRFCMERPLDPKNSGGKINFPYKVTEAKCEIN